ncbi:MAG: sigma-70 family RNA polymerase sigma factor [Gammaproteobacteria bacterium]|nr:sigma-70 family RNA polymerase sigma factor [Pseudomonadales bacterium]MCP5347446.1 sigma-70 family RNA polymerase sigma factor [Pseudomonadales bacterium]
MLKSLYSLASDESLYARFARGNAAAFEVLYQRHKDSLFGYLYRSRADLPAIEEIAQETWLAVIDSARDFQGSAKFRTYLFAIAHRKLVDSWRRKRQENVMVREDAQGRPVTESLEAGVAGTPGNTELAMDLLMALESLPREQQQAYLLKEEGFSRREISAMTGSSEETVKSRIRYANKQLRSLLEVQYVD